MSSVKRMSVGEFKSRFSQVLDAVGKGESITVTFGRKKKAVAVVSPPPAKGNKRPLGQLAGKVRITIADDWEISDSEFLGS
jgi:antitoxin (DNA-binding transcriptional repressor) of toxin-antitoxin stability system